LAPNFFTVPSQVCSMNWNRPAADDVPARADGFIALSRRAVFIRKSKSTPVAFEARRMAASTPPADGIAPMVIESGRSSIVVNETLPMLLRHSPQSSEFLPQTCRNVSATFSSGTGWADQ